MIPVELAGLKAETNSKISEIEFQLERTIKDQNDKIDALLAYLGVSMEKTPPEITRYKVIRKIKAGDPASWI